MNALVEYSSSSEEEEELVTKKRKIEREEEHIWIRNFAHVDGNWPSYVYFKVEMTNAMETMIKFSMEQTEKSFTTILNLVRMDDPRATKDEFDGFHLSLSRTFVLKYDQIQFFVKELTAKLKYRKRLRIGLRGHQVLINDERTRLFSTIPVISGVQEMCHVIECVDRCMVQFGLSPYYANPIPHVSVASTVIAPEEKAIELEARAPPTVFVDCNEVSVTIGNKYYSIPLLSHIN
ncbi:hypothetical protein THRCLA_22222 [Thraustotheca clavata]|uniref:U6 snRNA phosphodiesterase 1 n=1 Tax=Thraustotheca clavata TaxID=74557 RepID=A0A1V9Z9T8_9STRA|nr:hypothetical protein THRCLA_22222 [Thraustotheca clavata]